MTTTYQPDTPRAALAGSALLLVVATFATLIALPAAHDARTDAPDLMAGARGAAPVAAATEVAIVPSRIEVIGSREPNVAWALQDASAPCKPQG